MAATYTVKLIRKEEVAEKTFAFYFGKPEGFQFKAGQYVRVELINPPETDEEGNSRPFSLASAPSEHHLMIATRIRETAFKRVLGSLPIIIIIDDTPLGLRSPNPKGVTSCKEMRIQMKGPFGRFVLNEGSQQPVVFITGGIGITPFRSMVFQSAADHRTQPLFLFYSNRRPKDAAFLDSLVNLQKTYPYFHLIPTMTGLDKLTSTPAWSCERGYINDKMLKKYLGDLEKYTFYIAGPPGLVSAMTRLLNENKVLAERIKTEEFLGY